MSKSWIVLAVIALVTVLGVIAFEFYQSINGSNVEFVPKVQVGDVSPDLGSNELKYVSSLRSLMLVDDATLNNLPVSVTPTPSVSGIPSPF